MSWVDTRTTVQWLALLRITSCWCHRPSSRWGPTPGWSTDCRLMDQSTSKWVLTCTLTSCLTITPYLFSVIPFYELWKSSHYHSLCVLILILIERNGNFNWMWSLSGRDVIIHHSGSDGSELPGSPVEVDVGHGPQHKGFPLLHLPTHGTNLKTFLSIIFSLTHQFQKENLEQLLAS